MASWSHLKQIAGIGGLLLCVFAANAAPPAPTKQAPGGDLFYRYDNDDGITVIDDHVPPQYAYKGYTVLNKSGRVVDVVPRALSEEERRNPSSGVVQMRLRTEEAARQRKYDEMLLTRYSSVSDIEAAKQRRLNEISVRSNSLKGSISGLSEQVDLRQQEAADLERDGKPVPEQLPQALEGLRREIAEAEKQIRKLDNERKATETRFLYDDERFRVLRPEIPRPADD